MESKETDTRTMRNQKSVRVCWKKWKS